MLTAEKARELFSYDPETGTLTRLIGRRTGCAVGTITKDGYLHFGVDGRYYLAHRVIFLMQTGRWPEPTVDHIDRDKSNNRWLNLREATHRENHGNRPPAGKQTATPGVYRMPNSGRYFARAHIGGKRIKFGTYDTPEQAIEAITRRRAGQLL